MRCTNPLLAVWYQPDVPADAGLLDLSRPRIIGRYSEAYSMTTPAAVMRVPESLNRFLRFVLLPCGKCDACRLTKSAEWVYRCRMEQLYAPASSFITLTVNSVFEDKIFPKNSLQYVPFQAFMKRLREQKGMPRIRFLMCGEYGSLTQRPHYHALVFGYDFPDRYLWRYHDGVPVYRSPLLEDAWSIEKRPIGFATVGDMCDASIQYVCRYVLKKLQCRSDYGDRMPEFIRCSNRPGLGAQFFHDYVGKDFYKKGLDGVWYRDYIMSRDFKQKMPRYYDKLFERLNNVDFVSLRTQRFMSSPDAFLESVSDMDRRADYLKCITKGRIKNGDDNV